MQGAGRGVCSAHASALFTLLVPSIANHLTMLHPGDT